ncbi:uncharacterized protein [Coffea arabica]|uniref:Uncharacterized protein isoform X2 n=1 Tax=Coffea arabica TaxID=13443 RepID=A0ABM4U967_COFAR
MLPNPAGQHPSSSLLFLFLLLPLHCLFPKLLLNPFPPFSLPHGYSEHKFGTSILSKPNSSRLCYQTQQVNNPLQTCKKFGFSMIWAMGFVTSFFKPAGQLLLLQALDLLIIHMVFVLQSRRIGRRSEMGNFLLVMMRNRVPIHLACTFSSGLRNQKKWDGRIYQCIVLPSLPCELQEKAFEPLRLVLWSLSDMFQFIGSFCCGSFEESFNLKITMARRCVSVHEVHDKMRRWTVLVQVVEKSHVLTSNGSPPIRFQRLMLTDSELSFMEMTFAILLICFNNSSDTISLVGLSKNRMQSIKLVTISSHGCFITRH